MQDSEIDRHDGAHSNIETRNESVNDGNSVFDKSPTSLRSPSTSDIQNVTGTVTRTSSSSSRQNTKRKKRTISELEEKQAMNRCLSIMAQAKPRDELQ